MGPHNWVSTILRCKTHGTESGRICLHVPQEVQRPLRCTPPPGGGGVSNVVACACGNGMSVSELQRRVMDALRGGIGQWVQRRAVVIDC